MSTYTIRHDPECCDSVGIKTFEATIETVTINSEGKEYVLCDSLFDVLDAAIGHSVSLDVYGTDDGAIDRGVLNLVSATVRHHSTTECEWGHEWLIGRKS